MTRDIIKKIPSVVMLVCCALMAAAIYREYAPDMERSPKVVLLYSVIFTILLYVFVFILGFNKEKHPLFRVLGLVMLFLCNVFCFGGIAAQMVFVFAFALDLAVDNIRISQPVNLAVVIACFIICGLAATVLTPFVEKIKAPKLVTDLQSKWFAIFESETNPASGTGNGSGAQEIVEVNQGRLAGNVITNDPFDSHDQTPTMTVKASYDLDKMMVFACYDYDPEKTRFELADPSATSDGSAERYFDKAFANNVSEAQLPYWIEVTDDSIYFPIRILPYCDFRSPNGADQYKDSYLMSNVDQRPQFYKYYIDPSAYYQTSSQGYNNYVLNNYITVPSEFKDELTEFLRSKEIGLSYYAKTETIQKISEIFKTEYTYSDEPPALLDGEDPVMWFLLGSKTGYSKHFAAAQVLVLRAAGIPARYTYGYNMDMRAGEEYKVTEGNAYAYCQVFLNGYWQMIDELEEPRHHEGSEVDPKQGMEQHVDLPEPEPEPEPEIPTQEKFNWKKVYVPAAVIAVLAALFFLLRHLAKKYAPTVLQRINGSYRALKKHYFVRQAILGCMLKVRYSKEGPEESDALMLEREVRSAASNFKSQRKLFALLAFRIFLGVQKAKAIASNMFR